MKAAREREMAMMMEEEEEEAPMPMPEPETELSPECMPFKAMIDMTKRMMGPSGEGVSEVEEGGGGKGSSVIC